MGESFKGQYAPELYNEEKRYYLLQAQEFANLTDAELRDMHQMSNTFTRRIVQTEMGDSAVGNGFKISEHPSDPTGNFLVQGGDGSLDGPGVMFLKGYRLSLRNSIGYKDQTSTGSITDDAYTQTNLLGLTDCSGSSHDFYGVTNRSGNTIVVGSDSIALKSSDTGKNFHDVAAYGTLYGTTFSDSTIVYGVGFDGTDTVVARSMNSGDSWGNLVGYSAFNPQDTSGAFYGVSFINQNTGYIVGVLGQIYKTNEGEADPSALTWTKQITGTLNILRAIDFADANNIWVVGDNKTILYSGDGLTWSSQSSVDGTHFTGVSVINSTTVVVCGNNGYIQKTTDGGSSWIPKFSDTLVDLNSIYFIDSNKGWAVGNNGVITHSADGGNTWDATVINSSYNFKSVFFRDATTGFIAGNSGAIYRTVDGTVWDLYRTDYAYVDFHLAEVSGDISSGADYVDSTLVDPLIGLPCANRLRIVQDIKVSEGWPTPVDYTTAGPDGTVIQHYTYTLAKIHRPFGSSTILNADITDARKVVRTVEELDYALKNGGVDASSLASGSITPDKLDPGASYTMGSLRVQNDSTIGGNLRIQGTLSVDSTVAITTITSKLIVQGSSSLGDSTRPYDSSAVIYGPIIQNNDTSRSAYDLHSYSTTVNAPVINVQQDGSGSVLKITQTGNSTLPLMDVTSSTYDYDISIKHNGFSGGIIKSYDDSTKTSYLINKNAIGSYAPVLGITTNAYGPTIDIRNTAVRNTTSINIDQSSGSALNITVRNDATPIIINSSSSGSDLKINHTGTTGYVLDATSSGSGIFNIRNNKGPLGTLTQKANENLFVLTKDSTGSGRTLEINHSGIDPAIQINNDGSGIGLHVSHVGSSSVPAVDVYVAGSGPAVRIRKANNDSSADVGQALYVINQGFSPAVQVLHDNTDSTTALLSIANYSKGYDASALNWRIDKSGNFFTNGDVTTSRLFFDSTFYLSAERFFLDSSNFDSSNPGIAGRVFQDGGFLRFSDGTTELPPPGGFGKTGLQGMTGIAGLNGPQGVTGLALGATGIQGVTGFEGPQGVTGLPGIGQQGVTGILGIDGQTGIQGMTGLPGIGQTGIQGITGILGIDGQTGIQGVTGFSGQTGIAGGAGVTGFQGFTGLQTPMALSLGLFAAADSVAVSNGTVGIPISAKLNGKNLTELLAVVSTPGIASTTDVTVRRRRAGVEVFMLATATKISSGSYYSNNGVVNVSNQQVLIGDLLFVDVTNTNTTAPLGLSVVLTFDV